VTILVLVVCMHVPNADYSYNAEINIYIDFFCDNRSVYKIQLQLSC
jgi:hypothetical protein